MSDIDFDELDKAVNTALGSKTEPAVVNPVEPPLSTSVADGTVTTKVVVEPPASTPTITAVPQRTPLTSPAAKRSGRFMDMVHPSSDMAGETTARPTAKLKIVPSADFEKESKPVEDLSETEASALLASMPVPDEQSTEVVPEPPAIPDPLDVMPVTVDEKPAEAVKEDATTDESEDALDVSHLSDEFSVGAPTEETAPEVVPAEPAAVPVPAEATPFLTDAKVEKRPLGGFGPVDEPEQIKDEQLEAETALPEALQSDIVAVESASFAQESFSTAADESAHLEVTSKDEPTVVSGAPTQSPSIPQQYRSAPTSLDETPHSVFDTDQYHQPMIAAHAAHKGSRTWVFVLIILALLVVGAALGYFAFMSGL